MPDEVKGVVGKGEVRSCACSSEAGVWVGVWFMAWVLEREAERLRFMSGLDDAVVVPGCACEWG